MNEETIFNKVKGNDFIDFKKYMNCNDFCEDEFWSLMLNNEDDELIRKLSIYCNGDIGLDFEYGIFRLFNNSKINAEQCYRALSLGKELDLLNEDEFYQILRFGDSAFKIIVFLLKMKLSFTQIFLCMHRLKVEVKRL
ncbi:hypothetical protein MHO82_23740 [Vibrio sp. Of7-15]|uniref:hypothetical protein n=1 Tax=Vibrio sp. Of7-15 TaxID=2724879 RepID=UPI001EF1DE09|nr:hypothetical protein [Vibrio sp. Of7-15]MCG7499883.1 hypothetical protein [Vibrio sp. Of7-15]